MNIVTPLVSIGIPVWRGSAYVGDAVRSVLEQPSDSLELVVSVDPSDHESRDVLAKFQDPRMRVVHSPVQFGMAQHYEWCLQHLTGEWVTLLGQDDGLMFDFTHKLYDLFRRFPDAAAFSFRRAYYFWPGCESTYGDRGVLVRAGCSERLVVGSQAISKSISGLLPHYDFPQIYTNGLVRNQVVQEIRAISGGVFYHDMTPDVYSGYVIAQHLDTFVRVDYPAFWTGTSPASTGLAITRSQSGDSDSVSESIRSHHLASAQRSGLGTSAVVGRELWLESRSSAIYAVSALESSPLTRKGVPKSADYEEAFAALTAQLLLSFLPAFPPRRHKLRTWSLMRDRATSSGLRVRRIVMRVPLLLLRHCGSRFADLWRDRGPSTCLSVSVPQGSIGSICEANDWLHLYLSEMDTNSRKLN